MMTMERYDFYEEYGDFITIVEGNNTSLKKLFETLIEDEVLTPLYDEKFKFSENKNYTLMIVEQKESTFFWVYPRRTENGDSSYLVKEIGGNLKYILSEIRKGCY